MSKNPKPTTEELRFVYSLILSGKREINDILAEYAYLYDKGTLMYPYRTDKRFVSDRIREFTTAEGVLRKHIIETTDPVIVQIRKEHFNHLAEMANLLLAGGLNKISKIQIAGQYEIFEEGNIIRTLTSDQLIAALEENLSNTYQQYGDWEVHSQLLAHIKAEYHEFEDVWGYIDQHPFEYVEIIRTLAQRKTFKDTCTVCKGWNQLLD